MKGFYGIDGGYGFLSIFLLIFLSMVDFVYIVDHICYVEGLFLQLPAYLQEFVYCPGQTKQDDLCLLITFSYLFRYLVFFIGA